MRQEQTQGPWDRAAPRTHAVRPWPLLVLAVPAAVAVWSGWVGIGQMTGFCVVHPLPGIWNSLQIDTAVTLPIGVEAYAAMALHAWLASSDAVRARTRQFARWPAICALALGIGGRVDYHLLAEASTTRAPWQVTTLVASLPVLVLGLGTALAHMLRADATMETPVQAFRTSTKHPRTSLSIRPADIAPHTPRCRHSRLERGTSAACRKLFYSVLGGTMEHVCCSCPRAPQR